MGDKETKDAISAAYDAFAPWSKLTAADRSNRLRNWYNLLIQHKEELGQLITLEQGNLSKKPLGSLLGVVGVVTPWNFPLAMITRKVNVASLFEVAVSNPLLMNRLMGWPCPCLRLYGGHKASEFTPLTALAAAELALQSGIPPEILCFESPQVRKITFTGSTAIGKKLMVGQPRLLKSLDDADLEVALKGSFTSAFSNAVQDLKVGNGLVKGPLINEAAVQKVHFFGLC
ncbi:putative succinate-semialdehyde dehydrogenase (NAD(+)) [Helianthus annuus]|nr:putative succinate-semialdehyde dehydrogenase (NAD(+)) [Helianthus annuus]